MEYPERSVPGSSVGTTRRNVGGGRTWRQNSRRAASVYILPIAAIDLATVRRLLHAQKVRTTALTYRSHCGVLLQPSRQNHIGATPMSMGLLSPSQDVVRHYALLATEDLC